VESKLRVRFWVEAALASLSGLLALVTLFWQDWIEALAGFEPDAGSGSFEWVIVGSLVVVCIVLALVARTEWQRPRSTVITPG